MEPRKCVVCEKEVELTVWKNRNRIAYKKFCSEVCRGKYLYKTHYATYQKRWLNNAWKWRSERKCKECGKNFLPIRINQVRCSQKCVRRFRNRWKREKRISQRTEQQCPYCEKQFIPVNGLQKYCNKQCMIYAYMKSRGTKQPGYSGTTHQCVICDKSYSAYLPTQKYCSVKCRRVADYNKNRKRKMFAAAKRRALKKSVGGSFTFSDWERLKEQYNYCCVACGQSEPDILLTIDHKLPLSKWHEWKDRLSITYDGHSQENIQPLCESCNNKKRDKLISFLQLTSSNY